MKLYLQDIVNNIPLESLPAKWQGFNLIRFSKNKTLFDFQQNALRNALKALHLYYQDKNSDKKALFEHYKLNGLEENFDYDLKKKEGKKTAKYLLEYDKEYPAEDSKIPFMHFIKSFINQKLTINVKLLLKPRQGTASVLENYKSYWFDNFNGFESVLKNIFVIRKPTGKSNTS